MVLVIDGAQISSSLSWPSLLERIRDAFRDAASTVAPLRHSHALPAPTDATLLLMPAWPASPDARTAPFMGVKIVSVFPQNSSASTGASGGGGGGGGVSATYLLSSATTGRPVAVLEGGRLTLWRTAAVSAVAADALARRDAATLLMVGAGELAPYLMRAHVVVRPSIRRILIWNRTRSRATALAATMREEMEEEEGKGIRVCDCGGGGRELEEACREADVICSATAAEEALIRGEWIKAGAHVDLVGSFRPGMREADAAAVRGGVVFVDSDAALREAGELAGGDASLVRGTLSQLVSGARPGRSRPSDITIFKSVGSALADLAAARLVYERASAAAGLPQPDSSSSSSLR